MNKVELIEKIATKTNLDKKQVAQVLEGFEAVVIKALKEGEEVTLTGFGTWLAKFRSARMGVNPQRHKERIKIPAVTIPKFRSGKTLKDALRHIAKEESHGQSSESKEQQSSEPKEASSHTQSSDQTS